MNKLDKIHKKDPKAIKDRDVTIRNQFAENVRGPWLRRDLKKRIRDHPDLTFTDIREEATLLIQDEDSDQQQVDQYKDDIDVPVYASQPKSGENSDLSKVLAEFTSELESIKTEVQTSNIFSELIANRHIAFGSFLCILSSLFIKSYE
jgi:hypothetical protein